MNDEMNEFFSQPYAKRQFLTFIGDKIYQEKKQREFRIFDDPKNNIFRKEAWKEIAKDIIIPGRPLVKQVRDIKDFVTHLMDERYKKAEINIKPYAWSGNVTLPPGHPKKNVLYVAHPTSSNLYVPMADFHRFAFEHKFSELVSILMHLGAAEIEVEHVMGWGKDFASHIFVDTIHVDMNAEVGHKDNREQKVIYAAKLSGKKQPSLPNQLVWYPHEAGWKQFAEGRTKFNLKESSLRLEYKEDYGVNIGFKTKAEDLGLDVGGNFEQHESTVWAVKVRFK